MKPLIYLDYIKNRFKRIKYDRVVFMSYNGHFSDNPMYVYNEMIKLNPNLDYIWLVRKEYENNLPEGIKYCLIDSKEGKEAYNSAHIIIDNVYGGKETYLSCNSFKSKLKFEINSFLKYKKNQLIYTSWHATCLKKMGRDQIGSKIIDFSCPNATMMMSNKYSLDILDHLNFNKIRMVQLGTPRNSVLFNIDESRVKELKTKLGLPLDKKIVMFAPTFRTDDFIETKNIQRSGINQLNEIDITNLLDTLSEKFGDEFVFLCRFHYHVSEMVDWDLLNEKYGDRVINGNKSDETANYLLCTDVLISDVSGIMFDFANTKRPTFIFFPDMDNYVNKERGVYIPIDELPFPSSVSFDGLINNINNFNNNEYLKRLDEFNHRIGVVDNSNSAKDVAEFILKDSGLIK